MCSSCTTNQLLPRRLQTFRNLLALLKEHSGIWTEELLRRFQGTLGKHLTGIPRMLVGILHKNGIISSKEFRTVLKDLQCNVCPCSGHIPASNSSKAVRNILGWLRKTRLNYFRKSFRTCWNNFTRIPKILSGVLYEHGIIIWKDFRTHPKDCRCDVASCCGEGPASNPAKAVRNILGWPRKAAVNIFRKSLWILQIPQTFVEIFQFVSRHMWFLRGLCSLEHRGEHREDFGNIYPPYRLSEGLLVSL